MLKCLRTILEMRGSAGLYVTTNGTTSLEALGLVCNALVRPFVTMATVEFFFRGMLVFLLFAFILRICFPMLEQWKVNFFTLAVHKILVL